MSDSECLVLEGKGYLGPLNGRFKELGGFWTGMFWAFPTKSKEKLSEIVQHLPYIRIHYFPLAAGQAFESYRQIFKAKFFKKQLKALDSEIERLKTSLPTSELSFESIEALEAEDDFKESLMGMIRERENLLDAIEHAEGMAKAVNVQQTQKMSLDEQLMLEQQETVETFLSEHKKTFSRGVLLPGFEGLDKRLFYVPGDLIIVQGMSNHGKTKWMEQKAYNFLTNGKNTKKNTVCVFISFENSPLFVKQDFLNLISKHKNEGEKFITYDPRYYENDEVVSPFFYPDVEKGFKMTTLTYEKWKKDGNLTFLENIYFEELSELVAKLKEKHIDRPIAIFLDYVQIIPNAVDSDGWERIKELSYGLERIAQQHKVIIIAGSQVNEKRETREGKDVYNAATIVEDVFNHSHSSLEMNEALKSKYIEQIDNKNIVSVTITKFKRGSSFSLKEAFLFDGYAFEEKAVMKRDKLRMSF